MENILGISDFLNIESKYDLYHKEVEGIQCWQYFRFNFWNYTICAQQHGLLMPGAKQTFLHRLYCFFKNCIYILMHNELRRLQKGDICFISHARRINNNGVYECVYTEKLSEYYMPDSVVLEKPFQMMHFHPVKTQKLYYTDFIILKGLIYYQFHCKLNSRHFRKVKKKVHAIFAGPIAEIAKVYHVNINAGTAERELVKMVLECQYLKLNYQKLLEAIHPKVVVETVSYSTQCMLINELCKKMNIPTIELQHGTMHADHAAYQYALNCGEIAQFPNMLLTFSEYWRHCIHVPIPDDRIKAVGFPYFEQKEAQYSHIKKSQKKTILFISQGTIGKELSQLAVALYEILDEEKYQIIYKLHPAEYAGWRKRYPWLRQDGIEIVDSLLYNLYEYFARSDMQVGVYSTAVYEGLGFGLKTFIYQIGHANTMVELCEQGYAVFVRSAEELADLITSESANEKVRTEEFWKRNALENMIQIIDDCRKAMDIREK